MARVAARAEVINAASASQALLHASLLCGVVESNHKLQHDQQQQQQQSQRAAASTATATRPAHWPRLVRVGGTPLGRAAVAPSCPPPPPRTAQQQATAPAQLTQRQISSSRALNEGCVSLSVASPHPWLHPQVAPVPTDAIATWILSHEHAHGEHQSATQQVRVAKQIRKTMSSNTNLIEMGDDDDGAAVQSVKSPRRANMVGEHVLVAAAAAAAAAGNSGVKAHNSSAGDAAASTRVSPGAERAPAAPAMWHFPWRVFGDALGICYVIWSASPVAGTTAAAAAAAAGRDGSSPRGGVAGGGGPSAAAATAPQHPLPHHEENLPAVRQSMGNLFVLLCDAFKTSRAGEAPPTKALLANLDTVYECVDIVCPGNGRCMPLFDTAMARKIWKLRSDS